MALEDLVSDLSNFKGQSQYDDLDGQIKNGVDFIPNTDAPGFTPKTDLESLYNKVKDGTVVAPNSGVVSNEKTRNPYGAQGEYLVANGIGIANPSHIISGDNILGVKVQPQFVTDFMTTPLADYNSRFSLSTPLGAGTKTLRVRKESFRTVEGESPFDKFVKPFSVETTKNIYGDSDYIKDLFEFRKDGRDTFKNVPNGVDGNGLFSTADFRKVANKGPFDGNNTHPIILRKPGSNWDSVLSETPGLGGTIGGVLQGALSVFGLLTKSSRNIADKARIGTYLLSDPGKLFIAKQIGMQLLNPTLESKIYNPLSTLGIAGANSLLDRNVRGLLQAAASFILPISHVERHLGGGRYEDVVPLTEIPNFIRPFLPASVEALESQIPFGKAEFAYGSRIAMQSNPEIIKQTTVDAYGYSYTIGGKDLKTSLIFMNPNKYLFPISSAPKSIHNGRVSFMGGTDLADDDANRAKNTQKVGNTHGGVTFNDEASNNFGRVANGTGDKTRFHTSTYSELRRENRYEKDIKTSAVNQNTHMQNTEERRKEYKKINDNIGNPGGTTDTRTNAPRAVINEILGGGVKRGEGSSIISSAVDKVNIIPYGSDGNGDIPTDHQSTKDFIKFRFFDVVNKKFIIFRAILEGITDTITPEYSEERYIGRPDKLFTYQGVDRSLSFTFSIYPKTKQELPVLMEKLNYLIGLCYPSFTTGDRMVTPFIDLTLGDMFVSTPGILGSLTVTVEEQSTWEITDNLQFPHFIKAACEFRHIGKHVPVSTGRHYDLPFGLDEARQKQIDRFTSDKAFGFNQYPSRKEDFRKEIFGSLGQPNE